MFYSCDSQEQSNKVAGYEVEYHEQNPLTDGRAQAGDFVEYTINIFSGENQVVPEPMEQSTQINAGNEDPISEVLKTMSVDDSVSIYVPLDSLPPEAQGDPKITEEGIVYHIKMNRIIDEESYMLEQSEMREAQAAQKLQVDSLLDVYLAKYKEGTIADLQSTENGVEFVVLDEGAGPPVMKNDRINVHYVGRLIETGNEFDNSLERGQPLPLEVGVGSVIQGWDEGLLQFKQGDIGLLFIPSDLAYGEAESGPIPPNSDLLFYVDILEE
jgi:FKBP-type peptidyl-prolyl cis-trans isomerase